MKEKIPQHNELLLCTAFVRTQSPQRAPCLVSPPLAAISFCVVKKLPLLSSFYLLRHKLKCKALCDCQTARGMRRQQLLDADADGDWSDITYGIWTLYRL